MEDGSKRARRGLEEGSKRPPFHDARRFIRVSRVLKHIEMLDVAIMGIVVVTCAGTAYHKQGG